MTDLSRRDFMKTTTAAAAAMALPAFAQEEVAPLRIGLVGCGGRGTGAAEDCLRSAPAVHLVAMGDMFEDRLARSRKYLAGRQHPGFQVTDERCFLGFDAYRRVLETDVDLVLFATPPGFRPLHVEAAIDAGKHVFMEKPVAVDAVGVRRIIKAGEQAREKGLAVVSGTQYRHHDMFIRTIGQVEAGRIGPVKAGRAYYNVGQLWHRGRKTSWSDMEWQLRNWYYFCWLSGDHIVEQHIHTIDVTNWVMGGPPDKAVAVGGRLVRTGAKFGNIYDHFAVDYQWADGRHVMSMCRQINGCANHVGAYFTGTKGVAAPYAGTISGESPWKYEGKLRNIGHAYVQEHTDLIESIRANKPLNEARQVAESTLTAIMGREAAYTGQVIERQKLLDSDLDLMPKTQEFGPLATPPVRKPGV